MKAMVFAGRGKPLALTEVEMPRPDDDQVLIRVSACAVCRTDLHIIDGELADAKLPLIQGHQIVGVVVGKGAGVDRFAPGDRVGVPWLGWTCGVCKFCRSDRENLCDKARFTGYQIDGGFAEYAVADARYCFKIPALYGDVEAAPLLCAGVIGYRALRLAGPGKRIGLYGFGAAAPASRRVRLLLAILLVPCAVASVVGVLLLYPFSGAPSAPGAGGPQVNALVGAVTPADCSQSSAGQPAPNQPGGQAAPSQAAPSQAGGQAGPGQIDNGATGCVALSLLMSNGPAAGKGIVSVVPVEPTTPAYAEGDRVVLAYSGGDPTDTSSYQVVDFQRGVSLWLLGLLFAAAVILLGRWKGVAALIALGASFVVLIGFMLPAILAGRAPLEVALIGSCLIMFAVLYISYGISAQTSTAVLGTLVSLGLIGLLSWAFTAAAQLTGLDDPTQNLIAALGGAAHLDPRGLLLAGFVIGALGVLDDVTVTQTSAVWELRRVNASLGAAELFASAMRIGRDHISSAVNTLVLAYAGAALPLLLFFAAAGKSLGQSISAQDVASEVVRTLAGSIGLVAAVPITTAVAALVASREPARSGS